LYTKLTCQASSEEDSSSGTSDSGSGSEESSEEDSEEEAVPPPKKRKAEELSTPAVKKSKVGVSDDVAMKRNLFVGRLSWNVDEDWLTREFEKFGELTRVKVMDDGTGRSKGLVSFSAQIELIETYISLVTDMSSSQMAKKPSKLKQPCMRPRLTVAPSTSTSLIQSPIVLPVVKSVQANTETRSPALRAQPSSLPISHSKPPTTSWPKSSAGTAASAAFVYPQT